MLLVLLTTVWKRDDCDVQSGQKQAWCASVRFALIA